MSCSKYSTHAFRQRTRGELGETQLLGPLQLDSCISDL